MLREVAANPDYLPPSPSLSDDSPRNESEDIIWLRSLVQEYLTISHEGTIDLENLTAEDRGIILQHDSQLLISFSGLLKQDAQVTYLALDEAMAKRDFYPLMRENSNFTRAPHLIHIIKGRPIKPKAWSIWPNILLFALTILSVLYTGTATAIGELTSLDPAKATELGQNFASFAILPEIWRGWPYAVSILLILTAHEMGHYLMMRYHKSHATLPYFIPSLPPIGTLGAAIVLREPLKNRKMLLDVGAAGPIAGFLVALPILFIGLATSELMPLTSGWVEGNSLLYFLAKLMVFGQVIPSTSVDVMVNQLAWAGWTGLFFTALNMLPLGQLDGGHVMYALFGARARMAYIPVLGGVVLLMVIAHDATTWLLFFGLLLFFGRVYAVPLNDISPLDGQRRVIGVMALCIFVLCFAPFPLYFRNLTATSPENTMMQMGFLALGICWFLPRLVPVMKRFMRIP